MKEETPNALETRRLIGQIVKMLHAQNSNFVDRVEVLGVEHGLIRLRFLDRNKQPVIWMSLAGIIELRETEMEG